MFTVLCRYVHSDWQSTEAFLYVKGRSNIMLTWTYIIVLDINGKHTSLTFYYIHWKYLPTREQTLTNFENRQY